MAFYKILSIVFPVFITIAIGYIFACLKRIDLNSIIEVLLFITIPALVLSSLLRERIHLQDVGVVFLSALCVVVGVGILSHIYLKLTGREGFKGFYLPTMFMNSGNMALPLALLAFGEEGLAVAILYYVSVSLLVYTLGISLVKGRDGFREIFRLPLIYATVAGIGLNVVDISIPRPVTATIDILGDATIPLMLLSLGYRLESIKVKHLRMATWGGVIRIFGGFIIAFILVYLFKIQGVTGRIIILSSSMPSAVINFILTERYDLHPDLVASIVMVSTVMSVFTTPLLLAFIING